MSGKMPWWAPLGGIVGAVAFCAGLLRMEPHSLNPYRIGDALLMIAVVTLIAKFQATPEGALIAVRHARPIEAGRSDNPEIRRRKEIPGQIIGSVQRVLDISGNAPAAMIRAEGERCVEQKIGPDIKQRP